MSVVVSVSASTVYPNFFPNVSVVARDPNLSRVTPAIAATFIVTWNPGPNGYPIPVPVAIGMSVVVADTDLRIDVVVGQNLSDYEAADQPSD